MVSRHDYLFLSVTNYYPPLAIFPRLLFKPRGPAASGEYVELVISLFGEVQGVTNIVSHCIRATLSALDHSFILAIFPSLFLDLEATWRASCMVI